MNQLDPDQCDALSWFAMPEHTHGILGMDVGMGKTAVAILANLPSPVLIICPATVKYHWHDEIIKWELRPRDIHIMEGRGSQPVRAADWVIVNYDILPFMDIELFKHFKSIIVDEMHYCKSVGAKRTRCALPLAKKAQRVLYLSGTPMPNRPIELYPILKNLKALPKHASTKQKFGVHFCKGWFTPWNSWDFTGASNTDELEKILSSVMFRRVKKRGPNDLSVRPPRIIELDLSIDEREKSLDKKTIKKNPEPIAFEAMSDILKLSGVRKVPLALKHIKNVLESEEKILIFAWHHKVMGLLQTGLKKYGVLRIDGNTPAGNRRAIISELKNNTFRRIMIAQTAAVGTGTDGLQHAVSYCIFVECPWPPGQFWQAIGRLDRRGQKNVVRTDVLTIHQSIDAYILHSMLDKMVVQSQLLKETVMESSGYLETHVKGLIESAAKLNKVTPKEYLDLLFDNPTMADLATEPAKKKRASKKKVTKKAESEKATIEQVREAASAVLREKDAVALRDILESFSAAKVSELDETNDYEKFIAACGEVIC